MFQLDLKSRKSIYEQVTDNLKELIVAEVLKTGDKLPSVREMSKTLTVNPNTVQKAYRELEQQGYVRTVTGVGTFVEDIGKFPVTPALMEKITNNIKNEIRELYFLGLSFEEIHHLMDKITGDIRKIMEERGDEN